MALKTGSGETESFEQPIEFKLEILKHKNKMKELEYERETERQKHDWAQERHRIANAEINKREAANHEREKDLFMFKRDNWKRQ